VKWKQTPVPELSEAAAASAVTETESNRMFLTTSKSMIDEKNKI
jgi:hypothetical protein